MESEEKGAPAYNPGTPTSGERRTRRSVGLNTAFRAIKAEHSSNRSAMEVIADRMISVASSTWFLLLHVVAFLTWILSTLRCRGCRSSIRIRSAC